MSVWTASNALAGILKALNPNTSEKNGPEEFGADKRSAPMSSAIPPRPHHWTGQLPDDLRKRLTEGRA
jgi:hypothetical protein